MKRMIVVLMALALILSVLAVACGETEETTTTTAAATETTAAVEESVLDAIVEAAEAEGVCNYMCGGITLEDTVFEAGIKEMFGVDIDVVLIPGNQREILGTLQMEMESGMTPSYDLMAVAMSNMSATVVPNNMAAESDWEAILPAAGIAIERLVEEVDYPTSYGYVQVCAYNSDLITEDELPDTYADFADPKYKDSFGWVSYSSADAEILYFLGLDGDPAQQLINDIVYNGPVVDGWTELADKLSLGEIDFTLLGSQELGRIAKQNDAFKYHLLDQVLVSENFDYILNGAEHENAAMLTLLWLLSADGQEKMLEQGLGLYMNPDSFEYQIVEDAKAQNISVVFPTRDADYLEWANGGGSRALQDLISPVLRGEVEPTPPAE